MFRTLSLALLLVACGPTELDEPAPLACADALDAEGLDYASYESGECTGELDDYTARYTCDLAGCNAACGPNATCVAWRPNANGGCNFACILNLAPTGPTTW